MNWPQLKTILWLRSRLMRNQWARSKGIGAAIAAIIAVAVAIMGATSFAGTLVIGMYGLAKVSPLVLWVVWTGVAGMFMFMWLMGLMMELQRSESIDLQRLMHLPVALGQIFIINYLASHLATSIIVFVPAMMGLALGLAISRGPSMLLLAPLALGMVCMVSAWTYCLRGWLANLMNNPRRRRTVIMVIMMTFILFSQLPNLYFNVFQRFDRPPPGARAGQKHPNADRLTMQASQVIAVEEFIPPLWLSAGAKGLAEGNALPALCGVFGLFAIGGLGLWRAYVGTVRFYRGGSSGKAGVEAPPERARAAILGAVAVKGAARFVEFRVPGVPEQAGAMAVATLRSQLRAPEVKIAWGTSILVPLIVGGSVLFRHELKISEDAKPFIATGAAVFAVFMLVQFFANQFGFDRDGFRALVLSPMDRRFILLGKNLACIPVGVILGGLLMGMLAIRLALSPLDVLAGMLQLASLLLMAGMAGNLLSILVPYRIQPGTMKPTKMPGLAMLTLMACHLLFPVAMAPAFVPALAELLWHKSGWAGAGAVNLLLSLVLAGAAALAYWQALGPLGRLLQRRETKILGIISVEVE
ncbi:MAG TPA: hypothetical protein VGO59_17265 [Verrucomicrobiae bacterium]|jgi:hypothetical protein